MDILQFFRFYLNSSVFDGSLVLRDFYLVINLIYQESFTDFLNLYNIFEFRNNFIIMNIAKVKLLLLSFLCIQWVTT